MPGHTCGVTWSLYPDVGSPVRPSIEMIGPLKWGGVLTGINSGTHASCLARGSEVASMM